jgi:hypothetical protein
LQFTGWLQFTIRAYPTNAERRGNEKHITAEWCGVSRGVVAQHIDALASAAMEVYD